MSIIRNFFPYIIVALLILLACGSYYRFMVLNDYIVSYEGECDPYAESCFVGCEDDECSAEYYYSIIERHADEVLKLCGTNVLECEAAFECQENVDLCAITYCDPQADGEDSCFSLIDEV